MISRLRFNGERTPLKHWRKSVSFIYDLPPEVREQITEEIKKVYHLTEDCIVTFDCKVKVDVYDMKAKELDVNRD